MLILDAHQLGFLPRRLQLLALPQIGGKGHDLTLVGLLQPFQDHAGVEPSREGKDNAVDLIGHGWSDLPSNLACKLARNYRRAGIRGRPQVQPNRRGSIMQTGRHRAMPPQSG